MINHFIFNGTSTAQLGLIVSGVSIFGAGSRKVEKARIPGRNGDLQIELGGFNNYTVRYTVSITKNFTTTAQQIREWLLEAKGYCDLTDTYHPDEIRKACFNSDIEFTTSMLYKYGQASIQFDCLPERYLTTNTPITTTATADTTTDTTMSLSTVPTPIDISLNGNTTQEGSSGKNKMLFRHYSYSATQHGVTGTWDKDTQSFTLSGTNTNTSAYGLLSSDTGGGCIFPNLTAGETYTLTTYGKPTGAYLQINYLNTSSQARALCSVNQSNAPCPFTVPSDYSSLYMVFVGIYGTATTVNGTFKVQLEKGSTSTAFEPFLSPYTPQTIHSVSGDNEVSVLSKNLLGLVNGTYSSNGLTATVSNNIVTVKGTPSVNTTVDIPLNTVISIVGERLTKSLNIVGTYTGLQTSIRGYVANTGVGLWSNNGANATEALNAEGYWLRIQVNYNTPIDCSFMPQIEKGTTSTTYEPYTRQSYPLYLPVENLLPTFNATSGTSNGVTYSSDGSKIYLNGTSTAGVSIVFTVNGVLPSSEFYLCLFNNVINNNVAFVIDNGNTTVLSLSLGTETNRKQKYTTYYGETYTRVRVYINSAGQVFNNAVLMPMITYTPTVHYTPYGTPPIELNKIGTYQDYIYKNGGKWYVHKAITKVDLGTLTWAYNTSYAHPFFIGTLTQNIVENTNAILSTSYTYITFNEMAVVGHDSGITAPSGTQLRVSNYSYTDATAFKNASNGVFAYYPLATATNTEITDTTLINQLNNIEKAYSYNGTTNILQVSNDNGFMLEVVSLHGSTFNSNYKGEPIITVNSTGLIYLNGEVMEVLSAPVTINCQTMQCYNGVVNMNNEVRVNDFPEIKIGANEVGSSMALTITPNNWRH